MSPCLGRADLPGWALFRLPVLRPATRCLPSLLLLIAGGGLQADDGEAISYNRDVRPILSNNCFYCHGPDANHREGELRLDVEEEAKDHALVEGDPAGSELFARITSDDPEERMPPVDSGKTLSPEEIAVLRRWIAQGAEYEPYWAYVKPQRHPAPEVKQADWPAGWMDRFLLARLESEGLAPSLDADPITLIRRLSFDLTGLPPTPEEVDGFLAELKSHGDAPRGGSAAFMQAYERVVDRLLASDRYGERMAMYWLDLVRYADTVGYHGDQDHNISPYRDYVIDAFNDDLPFDRFTREQLAGDLLPDAGVDQQIASGYNRLLQTSHEGGVQPKEYLAIYAADRVRNLSAVWMGATVGCAQCHDHKFDPYTGTDFYSLAAFFADLDEAQHFTKGSNSLPTARPPEIKVLTKRERAAAAHLKQQIEKLQAAAAAPDAGQPLKQQLAQLQRRQQEIEGKARKTMISAAIKPRVVRVLPRGNWLDDSGPVVQPAFPKFLQTEAQAAAGGDDSSARLTRLDLAEWLTDPEHGAGGLTARVTVNRLWYLLMGSGLSNSLDDFGGQGQPPVHPELLDNLAVDFFEDGWSVKSLLKQVVMSRAYRQTSHASPALNQRDPDNRLYARQSRFRLPAEMVRDNALTVGGLLVLDYGGASVKPYQPPGYYRHLNFPTRKYTAHHDARQWRRGLYVHWQRQFLHPMLRAFDAPSREECTARRPQSNTPLAALTLLNDPTFVEAARAFAVRIAAHDGDDDARLTYAWRTAVSRPPDDAERKLTAGLLAAARQDYQQDAAAAGKLLTIGTAPADSKTGPAELAAWTAVARALLNLNETITRN